MIHPEKPRKPVGNGVWVRGPDVVANGIHSETWGAMARIAVCSSFGFMPEPTWHVSVSARPGTGRCLTKTSPWSAATSAWSRPKRTTCTVPSGRGTYGS